jgi:isopenicillin N synthase-like dioxygenase
MEKAAVKGEGLLIPVREHNLADVTQKNRITNTVQLIDFSKFQHGTDDQRRETAKAILHGFVTAGFIYLSNIPITQETRQRVFGKSANFFTLPLDNKLSLSWTTPEANRGYSAPGREKVTQETDITKVEEMRQAAPDIKESFEIGRDDEPGHPNQWPVEDRDEVKDFRATMVDFFAQCKSLHVEVMRAIAVALDLSESFFDSYTDVGDNTLRLLHYPSVKSDVFRINPGQVRAGAHSDYGSITLLFQDAAGGLQVKSPNGTFVDATPIENTCVVNAGDLLARWSNDLIKSTIHRVVEPPHKEGVKEYPARYSIA